MVDFHIFLIYLLAFVGLFATSFYIINLLVFYKNPIKLSSELKTVSIIIPAYNEEKTIIQILEKINNRSSNLFKYEVLVIDDGSTDQSRKLLENSKHLFDKLLINETNKGKGFYWFSGPGGDRAQ